MRDPIILPVCTNTMYREKLVLVRDLVKLFNVKWHFWKIVEKLFHLHIPAKKFEKNGNKLRSHFQQHAIYFFKKNIAQVNFTTDSIQENHRQSVFSGFLTSPRKLIHRSKNDKLGCLEYTHS